MHTKKPTKQLGATATDRTQIRPDPSQTTPDIKPRPPTLDCAKTAPVPAPADDDDEDTSTMVCLPLPPPLSPDWP
jgi:hypothetical protein